jgi:hypothetical protein
MSGGGSSFYNVTPGKEKNSVSCESLTKITTISYVDETLLVHIRVNDILPIKVVDNELTVMLEEKELGELIIPNKDDFIKCIKAGTFYVAEVLSKKEKICKVKIKAQSL